ncbi:hypothetical protein DSO57_1002163 [Entomophthora muscae]|uniref:Uncharacterized protein n=1 Tax=Entomophthora muscae TaxID=34485 RepID=A0ACC2T8F4_9FUNG|nr:hypothetical protein DSO57_1002163 [Entomophthora muscae]
MNHSQFNPEASNQQGVDPRARKTPQLSQTQVGNPKPLNFEGKIQHIREALSYFSPGLVNKSSEELFSLLTDEKEFTELFNSLPEIINQNVTLKDFQKGNEELALDNLSFKEQLEKSQGGNRGKSQRD